MKKFNGVKVKYYGHAAFRLISPSGRVIFVDPWLSNPVSTSKDYDKADIILLTHAHGDHIGDTIEIAKKTGAKVYSIHEISVYLQSKGVKNSVGMNIGGHIKDGDIEIIQTEATHSSSIQEGDKIIPGGDPTGFVIKFENGFTVYHAGDTGVFSGMEIIGELYKPDLALLPIGSHYTMGPLEASFACKLLKPRFVIPMHYGTFPILTGTPDEFKKLLDPSLNIEVIILKPGEEIE
ncbi:MAG: metal-dependent hydrolase [Candidatus Hydrothermales bacterium]